MLNRGFYYLERTAALLQGKGAGSGSVSHEFKQAAKLMRGKDVGLCVDIGGNKGNYTEEILRRFRQTSVVVFEPSNSNYRILRDKFAGRKVIVEPFAVSDTAGRTELYYDKDGSGLASLTKRRLDHFGIEMNNSETIQSIIFEEYWVSKNTGLKNLIAPKSTFANSI